VDSRDRSDQRPALPGQRARRGWDAPPADSARATEPQRRARYDQQFFTAAATPGDSAHHRVPLQGQR